MAKERVYVVFYGHRVHRIFCVIVPFFRCKPFVKMGFYSGFLIQSKGCGSNDGLSGKTDP